jgi:hypothetical protein
VQGVLTVEDEAHILDPDIRLSTGEKIHILYSDLRTEAERQEQGEDPLNLLLEVNQWYEFLLIAQIGMGEKKVTYAPTLPSGTKLELVRRKINIYSDVPRYTNNVVQGIILDLDWNTASQHYLASAEHRLHTLRFVLIETAIGKMVLHYQALQKRLGEQVSELAVGGYLEWERARLDLLAVIEKRDPRPGE